VGDGSVPEGGPLPPAQHRVERHRVEQRLQLALQAGGFGTWVWHRDTGRVSWDTQLEAIFGFPPGGFPGTYQAWRDALHPEDRDRVVAHVAEATRAGGTYDIRHRIVRPDGEVRWIQGLGQVTLGPDGEPTGTIGCTRDVTTEMMIERRLVDIAEEAMLAVARAERLQAVTEQLAQARASQDVTRTLADQVRQVLGASGAAVALLGKRGGNLRVVTASGYPQDAVDRFAAVPLTASTPMTDSARAGTPLVVATSELPARYPDLVEWAGRSGHRLLVAIPLQVPERLLGVLLLAFDDRSAISTDELQLATSIAGQCSQALDRARLIDRLGEVASTLQEGLAPGLLPRVPGFDVAAVYRAGGEEMAYLSGDWYDVLPLRDGRFALAIGDVMGRGVGAATTMTRIRTAVRAYAWDDPDPAQVMSRLDAFIVREAPDEFVTMVYAVLDPGRLRLEAANAGHLPLVLHTPGAPGRLLVLSTDPPLGLATGARSTSMLDLLPGQALLLFTDGLVERRDQDIDTRLTALTDACGRVPARLPLPAALDHLVQELTVGTPPGDDVTALMVAPWPIRTATAGAA